MEVPVQIGKYEIIGLIGRGGMGVVYQGRDNALGRLVALKVMTSDLALDPEVHLRFLREARSVAALQHPNIVVVYELGEHNGSPFIAMEFLDGEPLDRLIRNHVPLTMLQKTDIILEVAKALQYAHDKGVIHRDVKPGNIMRLRDGSVKVVDFGIAHLADQTITKTGMVMGTLAYLAPEQLNGEGIDGRTDIFSLGVVLYELLSGKLPFEGASTAETIMKILLEPPPPLPRVGDVNPLELQPIVDKALAKKKEERYQSCSEFAEGLTRLRKKFEVLATLEDERKALLAQLETQGAATPSSRAQPKAAVAGVAPTKAEPLPQLGSRDSKRRGWMTGGLSILLATALIVGGSRLWRSHFRSRSAPTPLSSFEEPNPASSPSISSYGGRSSGESTSEQASAPTAPQSKQPVIASNSKPLVKAASEPPATQPQSPSTVNPPQATSDGGEQGIRLMLAEWIESFKQKDVSVQADCYAPDVDVYYRKHNVSRAFVAENKERAFAAIAQIRNFEINDIKLSFESPSQATVTFNKTWDTTLTSGKPYAGSELERLGLTLVDGKWRIKREEELTIYYVTH